MILLKIMQRERKLHIKQEPGLYKKWEWNDILLAKLCKYGVDRG